MGFGASLKGGFKKRVYRRFFVSRVRSSRTVVWYIRGSLRLLCASALPHFPRVQPRCGSVHRRDRLAAAAVRAAPRIGVTVLRIARPRGSVSTVRWKICSSSIQPKKSSWSLIRAAQPCGSGPE